MIVTLAFILTACVAENEGNQNNVDETSNTIETSEAISSSEHTSSEDVEENVNNNLVNEESSNIVEEEVEESETVTVSEPIEPVYGSSSQGIIPVTVEIPAIDVKADVTEVGLEDDGAMEVPDDGDLVGWFNRGVKPGATGNAVLAGHVDDRSGPAIFFDLKDLEIGDKIIITDEDGTVLTFQVKDREVYPYDDAPISKVFGPSSSRNLNLITCTGEFDRDQGTHRERLVVFTELVEEEQA
ncbi:class F sortase [Salipaludibacillus daqingensis]|uniref:class F sortase n=1 Tax=Salipaludibacillus daqingensis TaxID=3041001 RepID=UPI0024771E23|nr:class F sortase [Salipaludibacillus daqingensis]